MFLSARNVWWWSLELVPAYLDVRDCVPLTSATFCMAPLFFNVLVGPLPTLGLSLA